MKVQLKDMKPGDQFTYCRRLHTIVSITPENGRLRVVTNQHSFSFPVGQTFEK